MDPIHLRPSELDYELAIRNISGLSNQRTKTSAIRDYLKKEALGVCPNPTNSSHVASVEVELIECRRIIISIDGVITQYDEAHNMLLAAEAENRIIHLKGRLKRIRATTEEDMATLQCLRRECDGLVGKIIKQGRESVEGRISFNFPPVSSINHQNRVVSVETAGTSTSNVTNEQDFLGFSPPNEMINNDMAMRVSRGRGRGRPSSASVANNVRATTPNHFAERLQLPVAETFCNIDNSGKDSAGSAPTMTAQSSSRGIQWERELEGLSRNLNATNIGTRNNKERSSSQINNEIRETHLIGDNGYSTGRQVGMGSAYDENAARQQQYQQQKLYGTAAEPTRREYNENPNEQFADNRWNPQQIQNHQPSPFHENLVNLQQTNRYQQNMNGWEEPQRATDQHASRLTENYQRRSNRSCVPVNNWRVSFSGDGQGIHLFEFLSQVRMLQRSEMIMDHELLPMMVHLLTGRAKNWYGAWAGTFQTWEELAEAMQTEFLPANYQYMMLDKISTRKQRSGETVGEFLALMFSLFQWLAVPVTEAHKVYIVRNNLLPKYAVGVAPFNVQSLSELAQLCRRIESSSQADTIGLPFENVFDRSNRGGWNRPRCLNVIEDASVQNDTDVDEEVSDKSANDNNCKMLQLR